MLAKLSKLSLDVGLMLVNVKDVGRRICGKAVGNEEGTLKDMAWVVGSCVVVLLVIVAAMVFVPDTVDALWTDLIDRLRQDLNL